MAAARKALAADAARAKPKALAANKAPKAAAKAKEKAAKKQDTKIIAVGVNRKRAAEALLNHAIGFAVTTKVLGIKRKGDTSKIKTDADKAMLDLRKRILSCPEYDAIVKFDRGVRAFIESYCLPSFFKRGFYFLKKMALPTVMERCNEFKARRDELVRDFVEVYEAAVEESLAKLNSQGCRSDYPPKEKLIGFFIFEFRTARFDVDPALKEISEAIHAEEVQKSLSQLKYAGQEIISLIRGKAIKVVDHLLDRLTDGEDGKKKKFKNNSIDNVREFIRMFDYLDAAADVTLAAKIKKLEGVMANVEPDQLRSDDEFRAEVRDKLVAIKDEMDKLVIAQPTRRYREFAPSDSE